MSGTSEGGPELIPSFMGAMLDADEPETSVHLCALCDSPIDDPLEECPVCAASFDEHEMDG